MPSKYTTMPDYDGPWIYIRGSMRGLVGPGAVVKAVRNDEALAKGTLYIVECIAQETLGNCSIHSRLNLSGIEGNFHKNNFIVDKECLEQMIDASD